MVQAVAVGGHHADSRESLIWPAFLNGSWSRLRLVEVADTRIDVGALAGHPGDLENVVLRDLVGDRRVVALHVRIPPFAIQRHRDNVEDRIRRIQLSWHWVLNGCD